jgi:membrane-associated phospholipid phosphatase
MDAIPSGCPHPARGLLFAAVAWMIAIAAALALDVSIANWVDRTIPIPEPMPFFRVMKAPGHFLFTLAIAAALIAWHPWRWRAGSLLCLSGMASGLLCAMAKWGIGRTRPFKGIPSFALQPFRHGLVGLFRAENLSFPSGHTSLAFATAACLSSLMPRWRMAFYGVALLTAAERVLQNSHYLGDVVAAAALGVLSARLTWWLCRRLHDRIIAAGQPQHPSNGEADSL